MEGSLGTGEPRRGERRPAGYPIMLGERTVQPVAHFSGWSGAGQDAGEAWAAADAVEVLVTDGNGKIYRVPISVARNDTLRWLALAGVLVLPLNWLLRRTLLKRHLN